MHSPSTLIVAEAYDHLPAEMVPMDHVLVLKVIRHEEGPPINQLLSNPGG